MGTYLTGTYTILHTNTTADFDNFVYDAVYFSTATTMTINGVAVTGVLGETLSITVDGNTRLISGDSHNEVWQFVNIKTGLPTNG